MQSLGELFRILLRIIKNNNNLHGWSGGQFKLLFIFAPAGVISLDIVLFLLLSEASTPSYQHALYEFPLSNVIPEKWQILWVPSHLTPHCTHCPLAARSSHDSMRLTNAANESLLVRNHFDYAAQMDWEWPTRQDNDFLRFRSVALPIYSAHTHLDGRFEEPVLNRTLWFLISERGLVISVKYQNHSYA